MSDVPVTYQAVWRRLHAKWMVACYQMTWTQFDHIGLGGDA